MFTLCTLSHVKAFSMHSCASCGSPAKSCSAIQAAHAIAFLLGFACLDLGLHVGPFARECHLAAMLLQQHAQAAVAPLPYTGGLLASAGLVRTKTAPHGFEFMLSSFVCCHYKDGHFCCGDMLRDST